MNTEKVQQIISEELEAYRKSIKYARQHNPSKTHIAKLEELGILSLMPAKFGNSDAQHIIKCAIDSGATVGGFVNGEGDVEKMPAHRLHIALNEVEQPELEPVVTEEFEYAPYGDQVESKKEAIRLMSHKNPQFQYSGLEAAIVNKAWHGEDIQFASAIIKYFIGVQSPRDYAPSPLNQVLGVLMQQERDNSNPRESLALEALSYYCNENQSKFILNACDDLAFGSKFEHLKSALIVLQNRNIITSDEFNALLGNIYGEKKRQIKPHKGGRTQRVEFRATPEVKSYLENKSETVADWIERKVKEERDQK